MNGVVLIDAILRLLWIWEDEEVKQEEDEGEKEEGIYSRFEFINKEHEDLIINFANIISPGSFPLLSLQGWAHL